METLLSVLVAALLQDAAELRIAGREIGAESSPKAPGASDWPRWAGPRDNCTSEEKGLLRSWPKEGPKVLWRIPVAAGSNHPSVAGDELCFAQLEDNQKQETFKCVDANTGREKWSQNWEVPPIWHVGWGELGPRATPTITP